jgi:hypothetical protein
MEAILLAIKAKQAPLTGRLSLQTTSAAGRRGGVPQRRQLDGALVVPARFANFNVQQRIDTRAAAAAATRSTAA